MGCEPAAIHRPALRQWCRVGGVEGRGGITDHDIKEKPKHKEI